MADVDLLDPDLVEDLVYGIKVAAGTDDDPNATVDEAWQQLTRHALRVAEIDVTEEQFERAWRTLWQRAFMGGNYTLDAKAVLAAIRAV